jgi:hypothetical protein
MANVPIRPINPENANDRFRRDRLVALVRRMLALNRQLAEAKSPPSETPIERQIDATDREIDQLIFELYDLTEEEIQVVGGQSTERGTAAPRP